MSQPGSLPLYQQIAELLIRDIAAGRESRQDTTTLEDYGVLAKLRENEE